MQALACVGQRTAPMIIKLACYTLIIFDVVSSIIVAIVKFDHFDIFRRH